MREFWLTFRNAVTEREYEAFRLRVVHKRGDMVFLYVALGVAVSALLRSMLVVPCPVGCLPWAAHVAYSVWEIRKRSNMDADTLLGVRTKWVCLRRAVHLALTTISFTRDSSIFPNNIFALFLKNGLTLSVLLATNLKLKFAHHLPCHAAFTLVLLIFGIRGPCGPAMPDPLRSSMLSIANLMNDVSDMALGMVGIPPSIGKMPNQCGCLQIVVWLHVFGVLGMLSGWLWMEERSSRISFIATLPKVRQKLENLDQIRDVSDMQFFMYFLLGATVFSLGWKVNYFFVRFTEMCGVITG